MEWVEAGNKGTIRDRMTTTERLKMLLDQRHAAGFQKYGVTVDRNDLTHAEWCQHLIEELLDGAAYTMRMLQRAEQEEQQMQKMRDTIEDLRNEIALLNINRQSNYNSGIPPSREPSIDNA